jgi:hypothetical protein
MFFSYTHEPDNFIQLTVDRVKEVMEMNKEGNKPADLLVHVEKKVVEKKPDYENVVGQDSLTRFDKAKKQKFKNKNNKKRPEGGPNAPHKQGGNPNQNRQPNQNPNRQPGANKPAQNNPDNPNSNNPNTNKPNSNKPNNRPNRPNRNNRPNNRPKPNNPPPAQ